MVAFLQSLLGTEGIANYKKKECGDQKRSVSIKLPWFPRMCVWLQEVVSVNLPVGCNSFD